MNHVSESYDFSMKTSIQRNFDGVMEQISLIPFSLCQKDC